MNERTNTDHGCTNRRRRESQLPRTSLHSFHVILPLASFYSSLKLPACDCEKIQHAFPRDFRAGPHALDWDPSKWIIELLHAYTGLVTSVRVTREEDVRVARGLVESRHHSKSKPSTPPSVISDDEYAPLEPEPGPELETWSAERINIYINGQGQPEARAQNHKLTRAVLFVDGFVVDITEYTSIHVRMRLSIASLALAAHPNLLSYAYAHAHGCSWR